MLQKNVTHSVLFFLFIQSINKFYIVNISCNNNLLIVTMTKKTNKYSNKTPVITVALKEKLCIYIYDK